MLLPDIGLGRIGQIGIIVRDLRVTMEHYWHLLGIGPWRGYVNSAPPLQVQYRGRPASYRVRVALAQTEAVVVELIEYLSGDTIHREFLAEHGEGIEHIGVYVPSLDEPLARLRSRGLTILQSGDGLGSSGDGRYVYLDTRSTLGVVLELIQVPTQRAEPEFTYP